MERDDSVFIIGPPAWIEWRGIRWYRNKQGYYQDRTGSLLHVCVWEYVNRERLPKGCVVHHINEDKSDNTPDNIELKTRVEHSSLHHAGRQHTDATRNNMSESAKLSWTTRP